MSDEQISPEERTITYYRGMARYDFIYRRPYNSDWWNAWQVDEAIVKQAYQEAWKQAEKEKQEEGNARMYLRELLSDMESGNEWYGTSFDDPVQLVKQTLEELDKPFAPAQREIETLHKALDEVLALFVSSHGWDYTAVEDGLNALALHPELPTTEAFAKAIRERENV